MPNIGDFDFKKQLRDATLSFSCEGDGLSFGLPDIEQYMDGKGFHPGTMVTLIAKPKVGKTFLVLNIIDHLVNSRKKVLFISIEMNSRSIIKRLFRMVLGLGYMEAKDFVSDENNDQMIDATFAEYMERCRIVDMKDISISDIRQLISQFEPSVVFIDYLHIVNENGISETDKVSRIAKGLADLAQTTNTIVFALAQTGKDEKKGWEMPDSSSGKWSSDIHIASDILMGMCRLDLDPSVTPADRNKVELQVLESRHGSSSPPVVYLYDEKTTRIYSMKDANKVRDRITGERK